ncbi:ribulose-phosphate 3-epimerase [Flavobacteriaceae bacterium]|nr:ribulose-phosphate 3-epimerase [Flavobacteriaceae bacterium]
MKEKIIAPSMLAADFANLERDTKLVDQSSAQWVHIDVMDGVFVPNISYGMPVIKAIDKHTDKVMDVHLMIVDPDRYIKDFKAVGADNLTVHYETCNHLHRTIQAIKAEGMKAGVSLNPHTPVAVLEDIISDLDIVLIMSVNPGFGGQSFIENTYKKVQQVKNMVEYYQADVIIEVDGGVGPDNIAQLSEVGVDAFVAGSSVFKAEDPAMMIDKLKQLAEN